MLVISAEHSGDGVVLCVPALVGDRSLHRPQAETPSYRLRYIRNGAAPGIASLAFRDKVIAAVTSQADRWVRSATPCSSAQLVKRSLKAPDRALRESRAQCHGRGYHNNHRSLVMEGDTHPYGRY